MFLGSNLCGMAALTYIIFRIQPVRHGGLIILFLGSNLCGMAACISWTENDMTASREREMKTENVLSGIIVFKKKKEKKNYIILSILLLGEEKVQLLKIHLPIKITDMIFDLMRRIKNQ